MRWLFELVWLFIRLNTRRTMMIFVGLVQPVFTVWLYALNWPPAFSGAEAFWYILVNAGLVNSWTILVFSTLSEVDRDRWTGLLGQYLPMPTPLLGIMTVRTLANFLFLCVSLAMTAMLACIVVRPEAGDLLSRAWVWLLLTMVAITLIAVLFSMIVAMTVRGRVIMNFIDYPVVFVSALGFSATLFPSLLTKFALCLPQGFLAEMARYKAGVAPISPAELVWWPAPVLVGLSLFALAATLLRQMQRTLLAQGNLA